MRREALREAHAREARSPPRKRRLGGGGPMCHLGVGGASVASGVSARRCRQIPSRAKRQKLGRTDHAFEAVEMYNTYNLYKHLYNPYNVVQLFEFVFVSGLCLFGSNSKKGTGT